MQGGEVVLLSAEASTGQLPIPPVYIQPSQVRKPADEQHNFSQGLLHIKQHEGLHCGKPRQNNNTFLTEIREMAECKLAKVGEEWWKGG